MRSTASLAFPLELFLRSVLYTILAFLRLLVGILGSFLRPICAMPFVLSTLGEQRMQYRLPELFKTSPTNPSLQILCIGVSKGQA